jgi:hypothetical protein
MKRESIIFRCGGNLFHKGATAFAAIALLVIQGCAMNAPATHVPVIVPEGLRVSGVIVADVHATGFQVYSLKRDGAGNLGWLLKAPDATFDDGRGLAGKHYAGPTWECTSDGSKVVGKKVAERASGEAGAVAWLLLSAVGHEGAGVFSAVTFIQRINTSGGAAPVVGDNKEGAEIRVPYKAEYVFYGAGATTKPEMK